MSGFSWVRSDMLSDEWIPFEAMDSLGIARIRFGVT